MVGAALILTISSVRVDGFESLAWRGFRDGGNPPEMGLDRRFVKEGRFSLRLKYRDRPPHWGNIVRPVRVPPDAFAVRFWLYKVRASPGARMFLHLRERDGDIWIAEIRPGGRRVGEAEEGWHEVTIPFARLRFWRRGNGKRQFLTVRRMLLGCNFGDIEVCLDDLRFLTARREDAVPLPRTEGLTVERGPRGSVAVLFEPTLPKTAGSPDPREVAKTLERAGFGTTLLRAGDLADPEVLSPENFDLIVLPYGPAFPMAAREAFLSYLKRGGSFISLGGYAFDRPLLYEGGGRWSDWPHLLTASEVDRGVPVWINTRYGRPGDRLEFPPDRIGVFDPSFPLRRAVCAVASPGQHIVPRGFRVRSPLSGWAATCVVGSNDPVFPKIWRRYVPLLTALDRLGRPRGPAAALAFNFDGPYRGSAWAFFGVDNVDLLRFEGMDDVLAKVAGALVRRCFIKRAGPEFFCYYRRGEEVRLSAEVEPGRVPEGELSVKFEVRPVGGLSTFEIPAMMGVGPVFEATAPVRGGRAEARWLPERFDDFLYAVRAVLLRGGRPLDEMWGGFCAWDEGIVKGGPRVELEGNYFLLDGRPAFLLGTNQPGFPFGSDLENPLVWARDLSRMRDLGLSIYRLLHFSAFVKSRKPGWPYTAKDLKVEELPEWLGRALDALVLLCQRFRVTLFLSVHDWIGVDLPDDELEAERRFCKLVAKRYRGVPGLIWDVQNEPRVRGLDIPDLRREWNGFLKGRYGSEEALREAWRRTPPEAPLGRIPLKPGSDEWDDARTFDFNLFRVRILNRWLEANVSGLKEGDPERLVTVGFLPSLRPADRILGCEHLDFSNMHHYSPTRLFPARFKLSDRRFEGKSLTLGEFGAKPHPAWERSDVVGISQREAVDKFLLFTHYALGLGGAFACNWDWKDMLECVFPWGLMHPGGEVPKDVARGYRAVALLFRTFRPRYESPEVFLLTPDHHRLGGKGGRVEDGLERAVLGLLSAHVDFGVIDEFHLDELPASARALVWPLPYCPPDGVYRKVLDFVKGGGTLYLSGDISFDPSRRRTRAGRLEELCGARFVKERYPNIAAPAEGLSPCIEVRPTTARVLREADGTPLVLVNRVGRGTVYFVASPAELSLSEDELAGLYADFLDRSGVERNLVEPDSPDVHVMRVPTVDGEALVLFNWGGPEEVEVRAFGVPVRVGLGREGAGMVVAGREGRILAVEGRGRAAVKGGVVFEGDGHAMLLSLDGSDLTKAGALVFVPFDPGRWRVAAPGVEGAVVVLGEVRGGRWKPLEVVRSKRSGGTVEFSADETGALEVHLIVKRGEEGRWGGRVAGVLAGIRASEISHRRGTLQPVWGRKSSATNCS